MDDTIIRPYLVVPKLIEQPSWGGRYIIEIKKWENKLELNGKKIGQSYELYDKSNFSLAESSEDSSFFGEVADNKSVEVQSVVENSVMLAQLISDDAIGTLGKSIVDTYGAKMHLLLKFTQALGNSFQLHVPDGIVNTRWKTKPESWYYFEDGLITCGVKNITNWQEYQQDVTDLDQELQKISENVQLGSLLYEDARSQIDMIIKRYNPWQYVNVVRVEKGTLLDLSACGIHHSWEEDLITIPLGNVLYEIQLNVMDDLATIRNFDKGKMGSDGKLRPLQIEDFFRFVDRSKEANDPTTHMRASKMIQQTHIYTHERLLESKYYSMDRVKLNNIGNEFIEGIDTFRHLFVQSGKATVSAGNHCVTASAGHSIFVLAGCREYAVKSTEDNTEVLISY